MWRRVVRCTAVAALGLGLLAGCGDDDTATGTLPPQLEDGTHFGYLVGIETDQETLAQVIAFDVATILEGAEAQTATHIEGCAESVDFCIDNLDDTVRQIPLASDASVRDIDYENACCEPRTAASADVLLGAPVDITIEKGQITEIEEVYFP